jgi:hypothetical protein
MRQHFQSDQLTRWYQHYEAGISMEEILPQITDEFGIELMHMSRSRSNAMESSTKQHNHTIRNKMVRSNVGGGSLTNIALMSSVVLFNGTIGISLTVG